MKRSLAGIGIGALYAGGAYAVEGKWTPEQVLEHDPWRGTRPDGAEVA
jgi:hypothetical protein